MSSFVSKFLLATLLGTATLGSGCVITVEPGTGCGPSNCAGCCDALGVCVDGTAATECGAAGTVCQACSMVQDCVADPATGSRCAVSAESQWSVTLVSAVISPSWSANDPDSSAPDAYMALGGQQTQYALNSYAPTWNQSFTFTGQQLLGSALTWQLFDDDATTDDLIGQGSIQFTEANLAATGEQEVVPPAPSNVQSIRLRVSRVR